MRPVALPPRFETLVDLLSWRAEREPDRLAYLFLGSDGAERDRMTYRELHRRAATLASAVRRNAVPGDRALILLPPSLEYVATFFGCLYAGVVAVTAYPPNFTRRLARLQALVADARPAVALTTDRIAAAARARFEAATDLRDVCWVDTATVAGDGADWAPPAVDGASLAFLQYTSGTTSSPRGVMVSHANLLHNSRVLADGMAYPAEPRLVSWLPPYHDMGLIGGVLQPLYNGFEGVLMAPATFAADPYQWLAAHSRYRGTTSYAPNFAYELCVDRVTPEQRAGLDLRAWTVAACGAEPIRKETMERFAATFAPCGFRRESLRPGYGLAEATLAVTMGRPAAPSGEFSAVALERGEVTAADGADRRTVVSCGSSMDSRQRIVIVDPVTNEPCPTSRVGEIWLAGPSVARGYWQRPEETEHTFGARLSSGEGPFLRTGDLGFLDGDQLYVAGRSKDLIILRGRNLYPQDIEGAVAASHPALLPGLCAATTVDTGDGERLVVVAEVRRDHQATPVGEVAAAVRVAVSAEFDVPVHALVLVRAGTIPRTSSGKIQRHACRRGFAEGSLTVLAQWTAEPATPAVHPTGSPVSAPAGNPLRELLLALAPEVRGTVVASEVRRRLAALPGVDASNVDALASLAALGLDSLRAFGLQHCLERDFGVSVPVDQLVDGTVADLTRCVVDQLDAPDAPATHLPAVVADPDQRFAPFPLTDLQHAYLVGRTGAYHLGGVSTYFYGEFDSVGLDVDRLGAALRRLVERHDMLRAVIDPDGTQRVSPSVPEVPVREYDLRAADPVETDRHLLATRDEMSHQVLPLGGWPMFDVRASRLPGGRVRVHYGLDLLVGDVRSIQILFGEWERLYRDPATELPTIGLTFRDYVLAARAIEAGPGYERSRRYWLDRLATLPDGPDLPLAPAAATLRQSRFQRLRARLDAPSWTRIRAQAGRYGVTASSVLLAAYAVVLGAWSRTPRFCLTTTLFNRLPLHPEVDSVVGDFTSVTLLETDLTGGPGIAELARRLQRQLWRDLEHRHFSGVRVLRELARQRGGTGGVTMPVVFTSGRDNGEIPTRWLGDSVFAVSQTPQIWLDNQVCEEDGGLLLSWDAVTELFPAGVLEAMFDAYVCLLERLGAGDEAWVAAADLLPAAHAELVASANATDAPVPPGLLCDPVVAEAARRPEAVAVVAGERRLSYADLCGRACGVAWRLRSLGVGPNQLVAVAMDKSAEQVVAALGVLLAGGGYVPVDPELPVSRQDYLVDHADARVVLVRSGGPGAERQWPEGVHVLPVELADAPGHGGPPERGGLLERGGPPEQVAVAGDVAYVVYTSGSTGVPKGVVVSHQAARNTCVDINARYGIGPDDAVLGLSSLSFDLSVWDIFGVLGAGGTLVLPEPAARRDPGRWQELVTAHGVTLWNSVPALMSMFVEHIEATSGASRPTATASGAAGPAATTSGASRPAAATAAAPVPTLRRVLLSGDWIPVDLPDRIRAIAPTAEVTSLGGATEAAIWSIDYPIGAVDPGWESIPYGRPLTNQRFHVLNDRWQECPVWTVGELFIGGVGLAEGYWREPEKTAAAFVTHPVTGERLYRTGDQGRWLPDGTIEFLGRNDLQVKVGGFRIELGEVEHALAAHPGVSAAVATVTGDRHHRRLAAYLVPAPDPGRAAAVPVVDVGSDPAAEPDPSRDPTAEPDPSRDPAADQALAADVKAWAETRLPHYLVPTTFTVLDRLPLSANGKVDRGRLPAPAGVTDAGYHPPKTPVEEAVVDALRRLLGVGRISVDANFFELGVDSVLILRLHRTLRAALGREFPLTVLFEHSNVRRLAICLAGQGEGDAALDAAFARGHRNREAKRQLARRGQEQETRV